MQYDTTDNTLNNTKDDAFPLALPLPQPTPEHIATTNGTDMIMTELISLLTGNIANNIFGKLKK